jgi:hypothetical protein
MIDLSSPTDVVGNQYLGKREEAVVSRPTIKHGTP